MFASTMTLALALTITPVQWDFPEDQSYYDPHLQAIVTTEIDEDPRPILFNGALIGKDAELKHYSVTVTPVSPQKTNFLSTRSAQPLGWNPFPADSCVSWGTSYVCSKETAYLFYTGTAYAAGNVYDGERVIQTQIKYARAEKDLTGWAVSQARYSAGNWQPGNKATVSARDSLGLHDPKTTFRYDYYT